MIHRFVTESGMQKEQVYNQEKNAWYWNKGSAKIEVFVQEVKFDPTHSRFYLRIFSPLMKLPEQNLEGFYRKLLELNDTKLGVKLTVMPGSDQVYATYERDIKGMDYDELVTCILDLEWWADILDDELVQTYGGGQAPTQ